MSLKSSEVAARVQSDTTRKLGEAIDTLREKYERKAAEEARQKAADDAKSAASSEAAARERAAKAEPDWAMGGADDELERLRRERMAALRSKAAAVTESRQSGGGVLREIVQDDFLKEVTGAKHVVLHFFHAEFVSCAVMDKHLRALAARTPTTRFLRIDAEKAAFFVAKLRVRVLPTLIFFIDGVAVGRQTGFDGLAPPRAAGGSGGLLQSRVTTGALTSSGGVTGGAGAAPAGGHDVGDFPTAALHRVLKASGVLGAAARERADSNSDEEGRGGGGGGDDDDEDDVYDVGSGAPGLADVVERVSFVTLAGGAEGGAGGGGGGEYGGLDEEEERELAELAPGGGEGASA